MYLRLVVNVLSLSECRKCFRHVLYFLSPYGT